MPNQKVYEEDLKKYISRFGPVTLTQICKALQHGRDSIYKRLCKGPYKKIDKVGNADRWVI